MLMGLYEAAIATVAATIWNSGDATTSITVTSVTGDSLATYHQPPFTNGGVRTVGSISGKKYFELVPVAALSSATWLGIANSTFTLGNSMVNNANAFFWRADGLAGYNSTNTSNEAWSTTQNLSFAIDTINNKAWIRNNSGSGNWNNDVIGNQNPATNTGGISISGIGTAFGAFNTTDNNNTATLKGTAVFSIPSGFSQL